MRVDLFANNPQQGAEYFGDIVRISILLNLPAEAFERARLAARYASRVQRQRAGAKRARKVKGKA